MRRFVPYKPAKSDASFFSVTKGEDIKEKLERIALHVPLEIIALFLFLNGLAATAATPTQKQVWYGVSFVSCLILTFVYFLRIIGNANDPRRYEAIVSSISFVIWAYGLGSGFFAATCLYVPILGGFLVAIWSVVCAWLQPTKTIDDKPVKL